MGEDTSGTHVALPSCKLSCRLAMNTVAEISVPTQKKTVTTDDQTNRILALRFRIKKAGFGPPDPFWISPCHYLFIKPVHTGDRVEFKTVDFLESRLLPYIGLSFNFVADAISLGQNNTVDFQQSRPC